MPDWTKKNFDELRDVSPEDVPVPYPPACRSIDLLSRRELVMQPATLAIVHHPAVLLVGFIALWALIAVEGFYALRVQRKRNRKSASRWSPSNRRGRR